ncbi:phage major capsid protein [Methylobacterium sp. J-030]|uniref:phage major capsid protein n=1 Tax=Methylobacterium sp. J-030 TaxID=2836627 RepID=UPI001FBAC4A5|nr:phage major capsid protein [Methylobacterium sp. J-030]MCJ2070584.1 phage major capsid protein [Methylobacterium sp. J-030]
MKFDSKRIARDAGSNRPAILGGIPASFLASCTIPGMPRVVLAPPDVGGEAEFKAMALGLKAATDEVKRFATRSNESLNKMEKRLDDVEQRAARRPGSAEGLRELTPGEKLIQSDQFKALADSSSQRGSAKVEVKTVSTMTSAAGSSGALVPPDFRADPVMMPKRRMTIRNLLAPGTTTSNAVSYPRQTVRNLNAAFVAETTKKPASEIDFTLVNAFVRTNAHTMKLSRQILDDAPQLQAVIDSEMRYGLDLTEEQQLLYGDGTGVNYLGIMAQAVPYSPPANFTVPGETAIDRLALGLLQAETALLPATGIVLHPTDWRRILVTKDGQGRYIVGDVFGQNVPMLWGVPVVATLAMTPNNWLVGAFQDGAQIFDRMEAELQIATENVDDFENNLLTVRCERRSAMTVRRPQAFVTGIFP